MVPPVSCKQGNGEYINKIWTIGQRKRLTVPTKPRHLQVQWTLYRKRTAQVLSSIPCLNFLMLETFLIFFSDVFLRGYVCSACKGSIGWEKNRRCASPKMLSWWSKFGWTRSTNWPQPTMMVSQDQLGNFIAFFDHQRTEISSINLSHGNFWLWLLRQPKWLEARIPRYKSICRNVPFQQVLQSSSYLVWGLWIVPLATRCIDVENWDRVFKHPETI